MFKSLFGDLGKELRGMRDELQQNTDDEWATWGEDDNGTPSSSGILGAEFQEWR